MKYKQQIFDPPRMSQENILHEAKISETQAKIKNINQFADQLKAHGRIDLYNEHKKEVKKQEEKLSQLIMDPKSLNIPMEIFHGY